MKEENDRLMKLLSNQGIDVTKVAGKDAGGADAEASKAVLEAQMKENQRIIEDLNKSWEQKLREATEKRVAVSDEVRLLCLKLKFDC